MSKDDQTIAVYQQAAKNYADRTGARKEPGLDKFISRLPKDAHVLDLGCGPGNASVEFMNAGMTVDAIDAVPAMVDIAIAAGVPARVGLFDDVDAEELFDGIWASYSLLHAARSAMSRHLAQLHRAAKPKAVFHIGMKIGAGEKRDDLGRLYTYYSEEQLMALLEDAGFKPVEHETMHDVGLDGTPYSGIWIQAIA
jgi:SAM-dependent methyltransferase